MTPRATSQLPRTSPASLWEEDVAGWREFQILRDRMLSSYSMLCLQTLARLRTKLGRVPDVGDTGVVAGFS